MYFLSLKSYKHTESKIPVDMNLIQQRAMVVIWNYLPALDWLNYFLIIKSLDVSNLPNALTNQIA